MQSGNRHLVENKFFKPSGPIADNASGFWRSLAWNPALLHAMPVSQHENRHFATYLSQEATDSPAQVSSTFWRVRATATFLPLTRISAVSGLVLYVLAITKP